MPVFGYPVDHGQGKIGVVYVDPDLDDFFGSTAGSGFGPARNSLFLAGRGALESSGGAPFFLINSRSFSVEVISSFLANAALQAHVCQPETLYGRPL